MQTKPYKNTCGLSLKLQLYMGKSAELLPTADIENTVEMPTF